MENTERQKTNIEPGKHKPIIAITSGDPNGVGYEVILKAVNDPHICEICTPVIYGNMHIARLHLHTLDEEMQNMQLNLTSKVSECQKGKVNIINCYSDDTPIRFGENTAEAGRASLMALTRATDDLKAGEVDAIVTAPINKRNIQSDKFHFSGHTEYLTHKFGNGNDSLMMMVSDMMRVALVCNHVPISQVPQHITEEKILSKLTMLNKTLREDFLVRKPRIAVLALNPHAGDNGLLGEEEQNIISPAIKKAYDEGIMAFGPYSADGFFGAGKYSSFDAILGMYHDQTLIPFKSLDMSGVNFTAGLDIVRTSPDHGTAYELAGKNEADPASMRNSLYLAIDILRTREENKELKKNAMGE
ncbi:MAG: 4-hydroxythreonine-4-phosphate dehydrogenase PdxA [Paludibacteraceae bacterium]|nr:4-hydroxythreonine-4-phosphate dehydrogenase PdxA [Paludibacteraceae bacterium]